MGQYFCHRFDSECMHQYIQLFIQMCTLLQNLKNKKIIIQQGCNHIMASCHEFPTQLLPKGQLNALQLVLHIYTLDKYWWQFNFPNSSCIFNLQTYKRYSNLQTYKRRISFKKLKPNRRIPYGHTKFYHMYNFHF